MTSRLAEILDFTAVKAAGIPGISAVAGMGSVTVMVLAAGPALWRNSNSRRQRSSAALETHHNSSVPSSVSVASRCTGTVAVRVAELLKSVWMGGS